MEPPTCWCRNRLGRPSKVIDSRRVYDGLAVRRRRECETCRGRYTAYEFVITDGTVETLILELAQREAPEPYGDNI